MDELGQNQLWFVVIWCRFIDDRAYMAIKLDAAAMGAVVCCDWLMAVALAWQKRSTTHSSTSIASVPLVSVSFDRHCLRESR